MKSKNYDVIKQRTEVQQAYLEGKEIEYQGKGATGWAVYEVLSFNWVIYNYRVKKTPIVAYMILAESGYNAGTYINHSYEAVQIMSESYLGSKVVKLIEEVV